MCAHCGVAAMLCAQVTAPCAARSLADGTGPLCGSFVACGCNVNVAAVQLGAPRPRRASPHGGAPPPTKATARAKFTRESRVGRRKSSAVQPRDLTACDAARWPRPLRRATICTRRSSASSSLRVGVCSRRPAPSPARCAHVGPSGRPGAACAGFSKASLPSASSLHHAVTGAAHASPVDRARVLHRRRSVRR